MKSLLFLSAAFLVAYATPGTYVITSPKAVRPNSDLTIAVDILNATGPVTVTATLEKYTQEVYPGARASGVFNTDQPGELTLKIPDNVQASPYLNVKGVTGSGAVLFGKRQVLNLQSGKQSSIFIQTDKGTYKPSDTVRFRVVTVQSELIPVNNNVDVLLFDGQGNRIKQWLQVKPTHGVITQQLQLSSQPVLGTWKIKVETSHSSVEKTFVVEEYVLPKFEVTVEMPPYAVIGGGDIICKVRAKYTYGKPVTGKVVLLAKAHYQYQTFDTSTEAPFFSTEVPVAGSEVAVKIPMDILTHYVQYLDGKTVSVVANVTEALTGKVMNGSGSVTLYRKEYKLEFPAINPKNFKPGLDYTAFALLKTQDDQPFGGGKAKIQVDITYSIKDSQMTTRYPWDFQPSSQTKVPSYNVTVGLNGLAEIPLTIPENTMNVNIQASYGGLSVYLYLNPSHSPSDTFVQLSKLTTGTPQKGDTVQFRLKSTQPVDDFLVQVLSRGKLVYVQQVQANGQTVVDFDLQVQDSMTPSARVVVYFVRADGEIVTDSISFEVSGVFNNKVSVSVSKTEAQPGEQVQVTVTSDPNSQAHLLGIDQSVLLLRGGNDITSADVAAELRSYDSAPNSGHDFDLFPNWFDFRGSSSGDASSTFRDAGVLVITDALVYTHQDYIYYPILAWGVQPSYSPPTDPDASFGQQSPERVRVDFSEVWAYQSLPVGANGSASVVSAVPDTITSWVVSAFAVNDLSGLGVAPTPAKLKVFRPFFVSLNLPYSVTRGEQVALQAIVFNYMDTDMQVRVTLAKSDNFFNIEVNSVGAEQYVQREMVQDILVKAGDAKSVFFPIVAADLGQIDIEVKAQSSMAADAVKRKLLVEPEGVPKEFNIPVLIDLTGPSNTFTKTVDLTLPSTIVQGSEFTRITAAGDLMVPSVEGLDSLLQMPSGCGEQNMLGMAPDVYVTDYLKSVKRLTGDIADKAIGYMEHGYQRELTYKHKDHSFSAFGDSDDSGSTWLTAFVCRVFHQAKPFIEIDDSVITHAIDWIITKQTFNGSFTEPGRVIHKNMQGKAGSGTGLSLFILISLLENADLYTSGNANVARYNTAKTNALVYLENQIGNSDDIYELALAAYAFQLAGSPMTDTVLAKLDQKATVKDGMRYWHVPEPPKPTSTTRGTWHRPDPTRAVDIEVTAYVLLTYAARQDLVKGSQVMKWITQQRNANGGFVSTQDTVVALNAMSEYAKLTYSPDKHVHITAAVNTTLSYTFDIDTTNAFVLQSREMKSIPAQVQIDASGSGMALVQIGAFFNVESEIEDVTFDLAVTLIEDSLNRLVIRSCARWLGDGVASGMAVKEIGIPSGFDVDRDSLPSHALLKRTEFQNKKLILYFDEININTVCVEVVAERTGLVAKSQPSAVRVYDYYEPDNQMTVFYQSQILQGSSVCDVCLECDNCTNRR